MKNIDKTPEEKLIKECEDQVAEWKKVHKNGKGIAVSIVLDCILLAIAVYVIITTW